METSDERIIRGSGPPILSNRQSSPLINEGGALFLLLVDDHFLYLIPVGVVYNISYGLSLCLALSISQGAMAARLGRGLVAARAGAAGSTQR